MSFTHRPGLYTWHIFLCYYRRTGIDPLAVQAYYQAQPKCNISVPNTLMSQPVDPDGLQTSQSTVSTMDEAVTPKQMRSKRELSEASVLANGSNTKRLVVSMYIQNDGPRSADRARSSDRVKAGYFSNFSVSASKPPNSQGNSTKSTQLKQVRYPLLF